MIYYESIDELPIYNWRKINETNDLKYLLKQKCGLTKKKFLILQQAWEKLYDNFLDTFGINDDFKKVMELKRDILVLKINMQMDKDPFIINFIEMKEVELNAIIKSGESGISFNEIKAHVAKFMGFAINEKETSTRDYYTYVELFKKENGRDN